MRYRSDLWSVFLSCGRSFSVLSPSTSDPSSSRHFVWVDLSHCFTVPYPCKTRKITSHQRNSKKGLFVHTSLSTTLSLSLSLKFEFFSHGQQSFSPCIQPSVVTSPRIQHRVCRLSRVILFLILEMTQFQSDDKL